MEGEIRWSWATPVALSGSGLLRAEIAHGRGLACAKLPEKLTIGARSGGEWLRLPGHRHRRQLKKLLQEANVLPWWRDRLPLVFAGDTLVAVADLWISAEFAASEDEPGVRIVWDDRPPIEAACHSDGSRNHRDDEIKSAR
jgi:tRNA(Ile)-lysidine synthase